MVDIDSGHLPGLREPGTRQARKRRQTRERLYRAALGLFLEKGFDDTTVHDITEAADAGKGTFFHHFPTKDHVLVQYWDEFNRRLLDAFDGIGRRTARRRLLAAMEACGHAAQEEPALGRVLLGRVFTSPALIESDQENEARLIAWIDSVLRSGVERGELRADADWASFRYLLIANLSNTVRDFLLFGGEDPTRLLVRRTRLLLRTVEVDP